MKRKILCAGLNHIETICRGRYSRPVVNHSMTVPFTSGCSCSAICYECTVEPIMYSSGSITWNMKSLNEEPGKLLIGLVHLRAPALSHGRCRIIRVI